MPPSSCLRVTWLLCAVRSECVCVFAAEEMRGQHLTTTRAAEPAVCVMVLSSPLRPGCRALEAAFQVCHYLEVSSCLTSS